MLKRLTFYITLFTSFTGQAQYLSVRGDFSIDQQRGCRDLLVSVTNINPGTDVILYQYEGRTSTVTANTTNLYSVTGDYWLYQYIQGPTGQKVDSIFVEIEDPVTPEFELQTCNNNELQVIINNTDYDIYEIDYGDGTIIQVPVSTFVPLHNYLASSPVSVSITGLYLTANNSCGSLTQSFTPVNQVQPAFFNILRQLDDQSAIVEYSLAANTVSTLEISLNNTTGYQLLKTLDQGTTIDTIMGLQLNLTTYCFRITSHDACSNSKVYSNTLCTIYADIQAVNNALDISWKTIPVPNQNGIDIFRDSLIFSSFTPPTNAFSDTTVVCDSTYCYYLESSFTDGSLSRSNLVCEQAFSGDIPNTIENVSSQYENGIIRWLWQSPPSEQALFTEILDPQGNIRAKTDQNQSTLPVLEDQDNCVKLRFTNICNNVSNISSTTCPMELTYSISADGNVNLSWSGYNGWLNNVRAYAVVIYDKNLNVLDSIDVAMDTEYIDPLPSGNNQISYYRIWASSVEAGITPSNSNLVFVERPPIISAPSSFTPNGDNLNDVFVVSGKYIDTIELTILNRWGSTIYNVNGNSWDGTANGKPVSLGNYVYHIIVKDFIGNEHIRTGSVLILKN